MRKNVKHSPPQARIRIGDVAARAEVSIATVSRVLNGKTVRAPLLARVEEAIDALGYVPHGPARALAGRRSHTLGAIVPTVDNAIFARSIKGLQDCLSESGFTLLLASSDYSEERELGEAQALLAHGIDGLVLVGQEHDQEVFTLLRTKSVPYVFIWSIEPGGIHPGIGFDNAAAARELARHVLELGHRRIAMIAGVCEGNDRAAARVVGVRQALAEHRLELNAVNCIEAPYSIDAGRAAASRLLALEPRPSAILCGNDVLAMGAMFECRARGIRVPEELSITGFDNIELAQHLTPALTTVNIPATEMGKLAAEYLMARLGSNELAAHTLLPTQLIVRETTAPPGRR